MSNRPLEALVSAVLAAESSFSRSASGLVVQLGPRKHGVQLSIEGEWLRLVGPITDPKATTDSPDEGQLLTQLLQANRSIEMVGLRLGSQGRLVACCDILRDSPTHVVTTAIWRVARVADRWELLWTGQDVL